jgi:hypothetical protein
VDADLVHSWSLPDPVFNPRPVFCFKYKNMYGAVYAILYEKFVVVCRHIFYKKLRKTFKVLEM